MTKFAPLCIWCNAEWSDDNIKLEIEYSGYCSTCRSEEPSLKIVCHACNKLMYEKHGTC